MTTPVVITGVGVVSPVGNDAVSAWNSVRNGRSGIATLTGIDLDGMSVRIGGEVRGFDASSVMQPCDARKQDAHARYGIAAAIEAAGQAGLLGEGAVAPERLGVVVATGYGPTSMVHEGTRTLDARGPRAVPPGLTVYGSADAASAYLSVRLGARGPSHAVSAACASGTIALGEAMRTVRHGYADVMVVVGAEDALTRQDIASTANTRALARDRNGDPEGACRPFDRARSGFVMSAGGAALVVESEAVAERRGARPLAVVRGYGVSSDGYHPTAPDPTGAGAASAMAAALRDAGVTQRDIGYINAHGTGTVLNDATELAAITTVWGPGGAGVPISSTKSTTGHLLGAAGTLEAVLCVMALRDQVLPPTINLDDPEFPEFDLVPHRARGAEFDLVVSNSFGFGGHNASLVLEGVV